MVKRSSPNFPSSSVVCLGQSVESSLSVGHPTWKNISSSLCVAASRSAASIHSSVVSCARNCARILPSIASAASRFSFLKTRSVYSFAAAQPASDVTV